METLHCPPSHRLLAVSGLRLQSPLRQLHADLPFDGAAGQAALMPLQTAGRAQSLAALHVWLALASTNWQPIEQHGDVVGSCGEHTAPMAAFSVQLDVQHEVEVHCCPQSHSSPGSMTPLPHTALASVKHTARSERPEPSTKGGKHSVLAARFVPMYDMLHGENLSLLGCEPSLAYGYMM